MYNKIEAAVREAGEIFRTASVMAEDIHAKAGEVNFVTEYDTRVQRYLIAELSKILPQASFYGEEDTEGNARATGQGDIFYIDPIDGTNNFMFGYRYSCVSVGLARDGQIIAGWVYNPMLGHMYRAVRGEGATLNGRPLRVREGSIEDGLVAFDSARQNGDYADVLFNSVKEIYRHSISVRDGGSAALDLCRVAEGSNIGYLQLRLHPYDFAAASLIVEEAGGWIGQADGSPVSLTDDMCSVIAGNARSAAEIRAIVNKHAAGTSFRP